MSEKLVKVIQVTNWGNDTRDALSLLYDATTACGPLNAILVPPGYTVALVRVVPEAAEALVQ